MRIPSALGIWSVVTALTLLAAGFVAPSAASAASKPVSSGGIGIRLIADESSSPAEPLGLVYVVERIAPGHRVIREVEISNTTNAMADIAVFPAASSIVRAKFSFAPGTTENQLSGWTSVAQSVLRLAPG